MSKKSNETKKDEAKPEKDAKAQNGAAEKLSPQIRILAQYIKDLSFENPKAPLSLMPQKEEPNVSININVNARSLSKKDEAGDNDSGQADYEVEVKLNANASNKESTLFETELVYAGVCRLSNVPKEHAHPLVMIECPRLLFPFAREIIATTTRSAGFPPLMIDPVDFAALYRKRMEQVQQQKANDKPN